MTNAVTERPTPTARQSLRADLGPISGIPFFRLVRVELRKLTDTTAGRWFTASLGLVMLLFMVILFFAEGGQHPFEDFFAFAVMPLAYLLPILAVMSVTSERSQRTAMTTYSLEPRRGRVLAAKVVSSFFMGAAAFAAAAGLAAVGHFAVISLRDAPADWSISGLVVLGFAAELLIRMGIGLAFGMLLLNTAGAIVAYLLLPVAWTMFTQAIPALRSVAEWLDPNLTTAPLYDTVAMTGEQWAQLGSSIALWVVLPLVLGIWRMLRSEVK